MLSAHPRNPLGPSGPILARLPAIPTIRGPNGPKGLVRPSPERRMRTIASRSAHPPGTGTGSATLRRRRWPRAPPARPAAPAASVADRVPSSTRHGAPRPDGGGRVAWRDRSAARWSVRAPGQVRRGRLRLRARAWAWPAAWTVRRTAGPPCPPAAGVSSAGGVASALRATSLGVLDRRGRLLLGDGRLGAGLVGELPGPDGVDQGCCCDQLTGRVGRHGRGLDRDRAVPGRRAPARPGPRRVSLAARATARSARKAACSTVSVSGSLEAVPPASGMVGAVPVATSPGRSTGAGLGRVGGRSRGAGGALARRPVPSPATTPSAVGSSVPGAAIGVGRRPDGRVVARAAARHALRIDDAGGGASAHGAAGGLGTTRQSRPPVPPRTA